MVDEVDRGRPAASLGIPTYESREFFFDRDESIKRPREVRVSGPFRGHAFLTQPLGKVAFELDPWPIKMAA